MRGERRRFRIRFAQDLVGAVAFDARRRIRVVMRNKLPVDAHRKFPGDLAVTRCAPFQQRRGILGILYWLNVVIPVAIDATGRLRVAARNGSSVHRAVVLTLLVAMAQAAIHLGHVRRMRKFLDVRVTSRAPEGAVDGRRKFLGVHEQRVRYRVFVTVASKTGV